MSIFSSTKSDRKRIEKDKSEHTVIQRVKGESVPILFFTTKYTPGAIIRHAVSGQTNGSFIVGTLDEHLFFKVSLSVLLSQTSDSKHLYYDSPCEYESHFNTTVNQEVKDKWYMRLNEKTQVGIRE